VQVAQQFLAGLAHDWDGRLTALRDHLDRAAPALTTTDTTPQGKESPA
jgi:hypothetical protein